MKPPLDIDAIALIEQKLPKTVAKDTRRLIAEVRRLWEVKPVPTPVVSLRHKIEGVEGIICETGRDLTVLDTDVLADSNALFAAPIRNLTIKNSTFTVVEGRRNNQYAARIACESLLIEDCLFDNSAVAQHEAEACFRLVACTKRGIIRRTKFKGNRIMHGSGATDEAVDPQSCLNLLLEDCMHEVTAEANEVSVMYEETRNIRHLRGKFIIPEGKKIAAIAEGVTVTYEQCVVSRDGGLTWRPIRNDGEDFKQHGDEAPGLVVI